MPALSNYCFVIRVKNPNRFCHFFAKGCVEAGAKVLMYEADIGTTSPTELIYYNFLKNIKNIAWTHRLDESIAVNRVLLDFVMDGCQLNLPWHRVVYVNVGKSPISFDVRVKYYFSLLAANEDHQEVSIRDVKLHASPYGPHPRIIEANHKWENKPISKRNIHLLFSGTANVPTRCAIMDDIQQTFKNAAYFRELTNSEDLLNIHLPTKERYFVFSRGRCIAFSAWPTILDNTRWLFDAPGFKPITHRAVEGCLAGCALLMHEESAMAYDPPFINGYDCLTYNSSNLADVVKKIMHSPDILAVQLAQRSRRRIGVRFGTTAVASQLIELLNDDR